MSIYDSFQVEGYNRATNNWRVHSFFCIPSVKVDTIKKAFIISAFSIVIIVAIGLTLTQAYPTSTTVTWSFLGLWTTALMILGNSTHILAQHYDILPSCMYIPRPRE